MNPPFVTVICPIYNEEKYIQKCVESILDQNYPHDKIEVMLIDGMSTDSTCKIIENIIKNNPFISIYKNEKKIAPAALNLGIKKAKGDIIIRIDAHCEYPTNYISVLVEKLFELDADNVGAQLNTLPANDSSLANAIAVASSHKFGVGNAYFRTGSKKILQVDTVPFGCFRAELFKKIGLFKEHLLRSEDDEFNSRIISNGGKIYLIPEISINYFARDSIVKMAKMFYQYGLFKPLANKELSKPSSIRQFFPLLFVCGLIIGGLISLLSQIILYIYVITLILYFFMGSFFGLKCCINKKKWKLSFFLPMLFFIIHISYGSGYIVGIFQFVIRNKNHYSVNNNR